MTEELPDRTPSIRRILVAIDASATSLGALEAAAELAERLRAELRGLFVHDAELLRVEALSALQEVDALSAELRPVGSGRVERQLRAQARLARNALERAASAHRVRWTFQTARGRVTAELRSAAGEADLVILGLRGGTPGRSPGSTARALLRHLPGPPVMILGRRARLGRTVFVVWDGSSAARRALRLGAALSTAPEISLTVLIPSDGEPAGREALQEEAERELKALSTAASFLRLRRGADPQHLARLIRTTRCGLLVLPREAAPQGPEGVGRLLAAVDCPVLVIGNGGVADSDREPSRQS